MQNKLPDFIVCGFQKCATSALAYNLESHSEISIARTDHEKAKPSSGKEINFFCTQEDESTHYMGIDWYKSHFKNDKKLWGYCSPNYSFRPVGVLELMDSYLTDTKIIFSIRNPIYRAFSAFNHYREVYENRNVLIAGWNPKKSFLDNFENGKFNLEYINTLEVFEKKFGKQNIHIIVQEKLHSKDAQHEYGKLFDFLNVKHEKIKNKKVHSRPYKTNITDHEIDFLKNHYADSVNKLFDWLGFRIRAWDEFC